MQAEIGEQPAAVTATPDRAGIDPDRPRALRKVTQTS
jgi:hypothetical protein